MKVTRKAAAVAVALASLGGSTLLAPPARATHTCSVEGRSLRVASVGRYWVDARRQGTFTGHVRYGQAVTVQYLSGRMHSGVWFSGDNGPEGWPGWTAPDDGRWAAPGANQYSLVSQFRPYNSTVVYRDPFPWNGPAYRYVGHRAACVPVPYESFFNLAVNDQHYPDNTGGFWVDVTIWS